MADSIGRLDQVELADCLQSRLNSLSFVFSEEARKVWVHVFARLPETNVERNVKFRFVFHSDDCHCLSFAVLTVWFS